MVDVWGVFQSGEFGSPIGIGLFIITPALIGIFLSLAVRSRDGWRVAGPWWVMLGILLCAAASEFLALYYIEQVRNGLSRNESFLRDSVEANILSLIAYPALTFPVIIAGAWLGGLFARVNLPWVYGLIWPLISPGLGFLWFLFAHTIVCSAGWGCL